MDNLRVLSGGPFKMIPMITLKSTLYYLEPLLKIRSMVQVIKKQNQKHFTFHAV